MSKLETAATEDFTDFVARLWGASWVLARATKKMRQQYGRCVTRREYKQASLAYLDRRVNARARLDMPIDDQTFHEIYITATADKYLTWKARAA